MKQSRTALFSLEIFQKAFPEHCTENSKLFTFTREHLNENVTQIPISIIQNFGSFNIQSHEGTSFNAQNFQKLSKNRMNALSNTKDWNDIETNFPCREQLNIAEIYNDVRTAYALHCIVYTN